MTKEEINLKIESVSQTLDLFEGAQREEAEDYIAFLRMRSEKEDSEEDYEEKRKQEALKDDESIKSEYQKGEPKFRKGQQVNAEGYDQPLIVLAFMNKDGEVMLILLAANGEKVEMGQGNVVIFGIYLGKPDEEEIAQGEQSYGMLVVQMQGGEQGGDGQNTEDANAEDVSGQKELPPPPEDKHEPEGIITAEDKEFLKGGFKMGKGGKVHERVFHAGLNENDFKRFIRAGYTPYVVKDGLIEPYGAKTLPRIMGVRKTIYFLTEQEYLAVKKVSDNVEQIKKHQAEQLRLINQMVESYIQHNVLTGNVSEDETKEMGKGGDVVPKEILEGNKLIAEFMGWKETSKNLKWVSKYGDDYDNKVMFSGWIKKEQEYNPNEPLIVVEYNKSKIEYLRKLLYDSSWEWLMPVVERIEEMNYASEIYHLPMSGTRTQFYSGGVEVFKSGIIKSKKESIWLAVVEFIKYYNSNK